MSGKTAYVMMGHGGELTRKNIVPPGCTLVVEVHSGEVNYTNFDKILNHKNKKIFLDPVNNYKELVNTIASTNKSLAIYEAGSVYSDFYYELLIYWDSKTLKHLYPDEIKLYDSGIIKYPFEQKSPNHILPANNIYDAFDSPRVVVDKYRNSIFPTKGEIESYLYKNNVESIDDAIRTIEFNEKLLYYQSDLFKILGPGIYYNLVCRATTEKIRDTESYFTNVNGLKKVMRRGILKNNTHLPIYNKTRRKNKYFIPEIMGKIEEAELHRKPYIDNLLLNSPIVYLKQQIKELKIIETQIIEKLNPYEKHGIYKIIYFLNYRKLKKELKDIRLKIEEKEKKIVEEEKTNMLKGQENYIWKKRNSKWGKYSVKNRNNNPSIQPITISKNNDPTELVQKIFAPPRRFSTPPPPQIFAPARKFSDPAPPQIFAPPRKFGDPAPPQIFAPPRRFGSHATST